MSDLFDAEQIVCCHDRSTGTRAVIAIDDTTLGPGLGGVRWAAYPDEATAVAEARRLAAGMTCKNAAAGLPYGGAKSVIMLDGPVADRAAVLRAFGRFVARLGGAYIPGVDMGTTVHDLATIGEIAPDVSCNEEDPSPVTARGVHHAITAAVRTVLGTDLAGRTVAIQGVGHVGAALARLVAADGARVLVADVDAARATVVAHAVGGSVVDPDAILTVPSDVLAPCAAARVVHAGNIGELRTKVIAGGANDTLAERDDAALLAKHGIVYVPDFVANAGGVIHIHATRVGWSRDELDAAVAAIGERVTDILARSRRDDVTPLEVAESMVSARLGRPVALAV